jgi:hypothetical protein
MLSESSPFSQRYSLYVGREIFLLLLLILIVVLIDRGEDVSLLGGAPLARVIRPLCANDAVIVLLLPLELPCIASLGDPLPRGLGYGG